MTLKDGQGAGEMLLDIETKIGELAYKEPTVSAVISKRGPKGQALEGTKPSGKPPKHERLGLPARKMKDSQIIAKNPKAVEKIKREAKKNEDIATKTAVIKFF